MKVDSALAVFAALQDGGVRYLVAGGLAVNAHGYLRFTRDLDLVIELLPDNIERAFAALATIGYRPVVPISAGQFADVGTRHGWVRDKGMTVLNFWSDSHGATPVDVFVTVPFPFGQEYEMALLRTLGALTVRFVTIPTLIEMKQVAGRDLDRVDIEYLKRILKGHG